VSEPVPGKVSDLARRALRGVAWTLPTSLGSRAVGLIGTLVLARYVAPADYGEVSAASIVTLTATSVSTFGIGIFLVGRPGLTRDETFHATCWFLMTGLLAMAAVLAMGGWLGSWFDTPGLSQFLPLLTIGMALDRIAYVPERVLVRGLRFRWLSMARAFSEFAYTGVSLVLAAHGFGAVAIAWGNVARSALRAVAIVPVVDWREWLEPRRLRLSTLRRILTYGVNVALTNIAAFGMRRWDNLMVSHYFGPAVMGSYNYAYNLAETPGVAIGEQIGDVVFASLPHVEAERRGAALVRSLTMISIVMLPMAFGLGAVAPTVAEAFFDQKWAGVGHMMVVLAALSATRPIAGVLQSYLYACERPGAVLWMQWGGLAALVMGIATVGRLGVLWTCGVVAAVFILQTLAFMWTVKVVDGTPISSFLVPLAGPIFACLVMVAAVVGVRPWLAGRAPAARLVAEMALGGLVYLGGAVVIFRPAAREFLQLVRVGLSRR
jgi:lipopolysaccharide exporter